MAAAVASCALGMATKETMVSAPLVVAVWYYVFTDGLRTRWRRVASLAATWLVLAVLVAGEGRGPSVDVAGGTMWRYLLTQAAVIVHYLRLSVVPSPLVFLYTWPLTTTIASVAPQIVVVTALVAATIVALVRRHPLAFPAACFFLILAPTSSVLPIVTEVAAEHRMYLPLASVISMVGDRGVCARSPPDAPRPADVAARSDDGHCPRRSRDRGVRRADARAEPRLRERADAVG